MLVFLVSAISAPPRVVTITTYSVLLEFQAANESVSSYRIEYAQEKAASPLVYASGTIVYPRDYQPSYSASQEGLIPGATYHIRVVPFLGRTRGIPSDATRVRILQPGM